MEKLDTILKIGKDVFITTKSSGKVIQYTLNNPVVKRELYIGTIDQLIDWIDILSLGKQGAEWHARIDLIKTELEYNLKYNPKKEKHQEELFRLENAITKLKQKRFMTEYIPVFQKLFSVLSVVESMLGIENWVISLKNSISRIENIDYPLHISDETEIGYVIKVLSTIVFDLITKYGGKEEEQVWNNKLEKFIENFHSFNDVSDQKFFV